MTFLFDEIVFGPVKSRRFGVSLGVNLLPTGYKYCTFNCLYCECGWSHEGESKNNKLPSREEIFSALEDRLLVMKNDGLAPDNITFAGNGEPTIHPDFSGVIEDTLMLRDRYFPEAEVTVLSNATLLGKQQVFDALNKVDNNVLKLDTVDEETFHLLNQPYSKASLISIIENIKKFDGNQIVQTLFVRGKYNDHYIDNTTEEEVQPWLKVLKEINPKYVMIYPIDRDTPLDGLEKISKQELDQISRRVELSGIKTRTYY